MGTPRGASCDGRFISVTGAQCPASRGAEQSTTDALNTLPPLLQCLLFSEGMQKKASLLRSKSCCWVAFLRRNLLPLISSSLTGIGVLGLVREGVLSDFGAENSASFCCCLIYALFRKVQRQRTYVRCVKQGFKILYTFNLSCYILIITNIDYKIIIMKLSEFKFPQMHITKLPNLFLLKKLNFLFLSYLLCKAILLQSRFYKYE